MLPISSWYGDKSDAQLLDLISVLEMLNKANDVKDVISHIVQNNILSMDLFYNLINAKTNKVSTPVKCLTPKTQVKANIPTKPKSIRNYQSAKVAKPKVATIDLVNTSTSSSAKHFNSFRDSTDISKSCINLKPKAPKVQCKQPNKASNTISKIESAKKIRNSPAKNGEQTQINKPYVVSVFKLSLKTNNAAYHTATKPIASLFPKKTIQVSHKKNVRSNSQLELDTSKSPKESKLNITIDSKQQNPKMPLKSKQPPQKCSNSPKKKH